MRHFEFVFNFTKNKSTDAFETSGDSAFDSAPRLRQTHDNSRAELIMAVV